METTENTEGITLLHDGYPVKTELFNQFKALAEEARGFLPSGFPYLTEHFMAGDLWDSSDRVMHSLAGRCVVSMVKSNQIDMKIYGCEHASPRRFIF